VADELEQVVNGEFQPLRQAGMAIEQCQVFQVQIKTIVTFIRSQRPCDVQDQGAQVLIIDTQSAKQAV